jgi:hypothetical protein
VGPPVRGGPALPGGIGRMCQCTAS